MLHQSQSTMGFWPFSSQGDLYYKDKKLSISYILGKCPRRIVADYPSFGQRKWLHPDFVLGQDLNADSMNILTSWKDNRRPFIITIK